ncbi:het-domain protein [Fusarium beomiforme]|uniref:Het-domain protein n=1 Tax=Fusarium beomiforme TaxID=44412 RepID=A0A9P5AJG6_9HYPO|nr:het-domain protein [Fusarium beomiforme]
MAPPHCYFCNLLTTSTTKSSYASAYAEYELKKFDKVLEHGDGTDEIGRPCGLFLLVKNLYKAWQKGEEISKGWHYKMSCHPNSFEIAIRYEDSYNFECSQIVIPQDALGPVALSRISQWINECNRNHRQCQKEDTGFRPTRLLDVGCTDTDLVRLIEPTGSVEYLALSHCWGQSKSFITTHDSMDQMKKGFLLNSNIPKTFADAIAVTRKLGQRYLWIDSLCIIQHDVEDWAKEASRMADVYRGAYLTIAAACPSDDREGFLVTRNSYVWELRLFTSAGQSAHVYLRPYELENGHHRREVLHTRAWTLQEQYLSRRVLRFCDYDISWECEETARQESGISPGFHVNRFNMTHLVKPPTGFLEGWYGMIYDYSSRSLSFDTDCLPALSGLASYISKFRGLHYCAGLWWEDIHRVFCWHVSSGPLGDEAGGQAPSTYIAPSWSWASVIGRVEIVHSPGVHLADPKPLTSTRYLDYYLEAKGPDVFGQLARGYVLLQTIAVQLVRVPEDSPDLDDWRLGKWRIGNLSGMHSADVKFDSTDPGQDQYLGLVLMRAEWELVERPIGWPFGSKLMGIIVQIPSDKDLENFRKCKQLPLCESILQRLGYFDAQLPEEEERQLLEREPQEFVLI